MSWHPNDLVTDLDLVAYEKQILTQFNATDWKDRRTKAIEDWLFPLLESRGFTPERLRTRHTPVAAFGYTSSTYTDKASAAATDNGLVLSTILAGASDALYVGFGSPFRGISMRATTTVNAVASTLGVSVWADAWEGVQNLVNGTQVGSLSFAKGGSLTWRLPEGIVSRSLNSSDPLYWAKLTLTVAPTSGTAIGPISVIRRSRLCAAVTLRTLALIFREAPTDIDGPWQDKAEWYEKQADQAFQRVAEQLGPEFDQDSDDTIGAAERAQTTASVNDGGWRYERA